MSMVTGTEAVPDLLGTVTHLLHEAATATWRIADQQMPAASALHDLGLSMFLARSTAAGMLPESSEGTDPSSPATSEQDPRALVEAAEELTRQLPIADATFPDISALVVQVCDLVRAARILLPEHEHGDG